MAKGVVNLISGSSGVGKNTVISKLMEENDNLVLLRSCTSRKLRVDDKIQADGRHAYDFLTKEEFEEKIANDEMLEYDIFSGNYYGVSKSSVEEALKTGKNAIKDITVKGVINCKDKLPKNVRIISVFLTLQKSKLKKRLVLRETKDIKARMKHYAYEQKSISLYDFCIINDNLNLTMAKMRAVLNLAKEYKIYCGENLKKVNLKKVEKFALKLKLNKKIKPIEVAENDGKIYIVKGIYKYLASIRTGVGITKLFVDNAKIVDADQTYWGELIAMQKK